MGEILIDEPDLIIDDPADDCVDYWAALVKEDKINNNILQTEDTVQVNLFEKNTGHKKLPKEKKSDLRKKIKKILANATFPPEQIRKAIEGYVQDPSLMDMRIDQVDPSNIFLFDVCSENFLTASEYERKGMLQSIEDVEFDWKTFQDCKELNLLSKHQDDFEPGVLEDEEVPKKKSCRIERYESPERPKGRNKEERPRNKMRESTQLKYQERRQDEQTKENDREKERDRERERRSPPEKKRLVKLKDQEGDTKEKGKEKEKDEKTRKNEEEDNLRREIAKERDNEKEKFRQREKEKMRRSSSAGGRDRKEQSREKERDRSRENIGRKRSNSQERNQEKRRGNYASRRDEDGYRQNFRSGANLQARKEQDPDARNSKALRPYNDNQAQQDYRENENNTNGYRSRMNRSYKNENQRNATIDADEKESRDHKNYRNYRDDSRTNKVMVIDDEDRHEPRNSSKYGGYNNEKPRQFDPERRNSYQQENIFNNSQFQAKANEVGQFFMQMMAQMMVNQFSSNPDMAKMMGQFMNGGGFPNRYDNQRPHFNNYNKRYSNNHNNDRGGFQKKPFYSRNDENDRRRRRSNSYERSKRNDSRGKENQRNRHDNEDGEVTEVTRRRNY